ncbi:hypothetical protein [Burkholderia pseudomultivorans]|uniref:Lipoprotein n=1 Tax=Burkholderia pseudomultivorans TaxID=1207504 RepID=A0ABU2DZW0_9BURK|nr:hypothetical protein [Burkholderia pseudomultivorans]MDR8726775.1 hypothetical protein [Burkholderia pseudomultivorans]MDR8736120.1 hypothetical protein [Burkholderia pseudomultivorans]MDR8742096.1 hypothetical protein [Burkholderia pseudomultivorans]MDR8753105.1 hypothetical protein [Burkholderia pseudomultivorans]MDR8778690.1 hypothetical protein [Burkholderia pseudomultivorans]
MRNPALPVAPASHARAYALSGLGACAWCLVPVDVRQAASVADGFGARPMFRCRLTARYASGLSLSVVCGNGYAAVRQCAASHVDAVSRLLVRDADNDTEHRVHAFDEGIGWQ